MGGIYIAYLTCNPSKIIVLLTDNEYTAWHMAAKYFSNELMNAILPSESIDENGERLMYFPTAICLPDIIVLKQYELEDGFSIRVYSEVI